MSNTSPNGGPDCDWGMVTVEPVYRDCVGDSGSWPGPRILEVFMIRNGRRGTGGTAQRFLNSIVGAIFVVLLLTCAPPVSAQSCTSPWDSGTTQSAAIEYLQTTGGTGCITVQGQQGQDDGGYIKTSTPYIPRIVADSAGGCEHYEWNFWHTQCIDTGTHTYHTLTGGTSLTYTYPDGTHYTVTGAWPLQGGEYHYDTCASGSGTNCAPDGTTPASEWNTAQLGLHTVSSITGFQTGGVGTAPYDCNMVGQQASNTISFYALKCQPRWLLDNNNNQIHLAPGTVQVYLPPSMASATSALDAAIADWNTALAASGVTLQAVDVPCANGPFCITVEAATISHCGFTPTPDTDSTGEETGEMYLQLADNGSAPWNTWDAQSLQRTFAHELGHDIGLDNYDTDTYNCDTSENSAVMQDNYVCSSSSTPATTPTGNDYMPANGSIYGTHSKNICGWQ